MPVGFKAAEACALAGIADHRIRRQEPRDEKDDECEEPRAEDDQNWAPTIESRSRRELSCHELTVFGSDYSSQPLWKQQVRNFQAVGLGRTVRNGRQSQLS